MKKHQSFFFFFLFVTPTWVNAQTPSEQLQAIIQQDAEFQKKEFNVPGQYFSDENTEAEKRRAEFYRQELAGLKKINPAELSRQDRINYELLKFILEDRIADVEYETYLVPLNAEGGWYTSFLLSAGRSPQSEEGYERYIGRLSAFKKHAEQKIAHMREGLKKGRTAPAAILKGRENIVDNCVVDDPAQSPFYKPFLEMPASIAPEKQETLRAQGRKAIEESVTPAYRAFTEFWKKEYIPGAVKAIGISSQPRGREYYEQRVRYFTTLPMTAEEVYETGQREVARIRKEMEAIIEEVGFKGTFAEFLEFLRTDPQFYAKTPEELLKEASYLSKKIDGKLPKYFGKLPRNSYGVDPVPAVLAPTYTGGRYSGGSLEGGRAGSYWVNTYNLPARPLYVLPSLTLHEAVPGHHLQISLAQEMEGVPAFRSNTYLSAYGEGWALYGEWLGEEMGMYSTPYERFGKLTYEMWRACRLVVDPGMHVKGWTRQQAIDFLAGNTALSLHECTTEIDRYIGWPGQAVSYKIGELKIRELRKKAEAMLGDKFDLRDFHDLVLSEGAVPLFVLEDMVNEWILAQAPMDSRQQDIVFKNVHLIPMDKEHVLNNQDVLVKNGVISEIVPGGKLKPGKEAVVIDGSGKYLMPGLAEMHAHVPPVDDLEPMKDVLMLFACNGITTIRGMLGHPRHLELRSKINNGEILGPRLWTSGPSFNGLSVKTPEEGVAKVREQKAAGYDFLKMHPGLTKASFDAVAATAQEVRIPFAGHVSFQVGIDRAIEAKYASIDHLDGFVERLLPRLDTMAESDVGLFGMFAGQYADESRIPTLMKALKENNIWIVPTQALAERWFAPNLTSEALSKAPEMKYMKASDLKNWATGKNNLMANPKFDSLSMAKYIQLRRKLIYECQKNGVGLLLGSDGPQVFNVPGFSVHHELRYLVEAGLTPYEALRSGTANVGTYFNRLDLGVIKTGAVADLVLLNANPLSDINQSANIAGVMLDGRWLAKGFIEKELKKLEK